MKNRIRPPVRIDVNERVIARTDTTTRTWCWRLNVPTSITGTKKLRLFFHTEKEALAHAAVLLSANRSAGDLVEKLKTRKMSVSDAVLYALKHAPKSEPITVEKALNRFIASRETLNCKPRYIANLRSQCDAIGREFGSLMIDAVTRSKLERFLADLMGKDEEMPASPKSRINYIITLTALMNFAVQEGWRGENPAASLRRPKLDEVTIPVLAIEDARRVLKAASESRFADIFPAFILQFFGGIRRSEIPHAKWELLKDAFLRLDKTKIRHARPVELPSAALEWLAPYRQIAGRIFQPVGVAFDPNDARSVEDAYTYRLAAVAEAVGAELAKNILRHTAITYRVALSGDLAEVSFWAGNSPAVIRGHYLGSATKVEAAEFYALRP